MEQAKEVVMEKCPVCNRGPVVKVRGRSGLGLKPQIDRCEVCGATFEHKEPNQFKLTNCEPHTLTKLHPSACTCAPRLFRECYLGMTFSGKEWERIAQGGEPDVLAKFHQAEQRFKKGELVPHPQPKTPFDLDSGETLFFVSAPIYLNEEPLTDKAEEPAHVMYVTDRRVVIARNKKVDFQVPIDKISQLRETLPGFVIELADSPTPITVYPPLYDPAFAALEAVLKKFKPQTVR